MKLTCWLLFLVVGLPSFTQAQTPFPPPPVPPPISIPNCPKGLMGQVNGNYYWLTQNCPNNNMYGYGQTMAAVPTGCDPMHPNQCLSPITPVMKQTKTEKDGGVELTVCGLPEGTPAERKHKLTKIVNECKSRQKYLEKVIKKWDPTDTKKSQITFDHYKRIAGWLAYTPGLLEYLEEVKNSGDDARITVAIAQYCGEDCGTTQCNTVMCCYKAHEMAWGKTFVDLATGRSHIADDKQELELLPADEVKITPASGFVAGINQKVYEVAVDDPRGPSKVYFKTFTLSKSNPSDPNVYSHIGVQVEKPADLSNVPKARFRNRNSFGHWIAADTGTAFFLVSSWDDLSVAP